MFDETGCVSKTLVQGLQRKSHMAENMQLVAEEILRSPNIPKSYRRLSDTLANSASSLYPILKELKLKPYMSRLFHGLSEDDPDHRLQFCEFWNGTIAQDPESPYKILWSDEDKFHLNGAVNRQNTRYWHVEAPEITSEKLLSQLVLRYGVVCVVMNLLALFSLIAMLMARITANFGRLTLSHLSTVSLKRWFSSRMAPLCTLC